VLLQISVSPAIAGGESIAVLWLRRCKNDSAFNDSAKMRRAGSTEFSAE